MGELVRRLCLSLCYTTGETQISAVLWEQSFLKKSGLKAQLTGDVARAKALGRH